MTASDRDRLTSRADVGLGSFDVMVSDEDPHDPEPFAVATYDVRASYLVTLSPLALEVTERRLLGLSLIHVDHDDEGDEHELAIPADVEGLGQLIALLDSVRDYLTREAGA